MLEVKTAGYSARLDDNNELVVVKHGQLWEEGQGNEFVVALMKRIRELEDGCVELLLDIEKRHNKRADELLGSNYSAGRDALIRAEETRSNAEAIRGRA